MIPKRKTPKSGQTIPSNQAQKPVSKTSSKPVSKPSSANQNDSKMPSIVELLQNQIDEERKNARNKNQVKNRQNISSSQSQSRQILHKKKNTQSNATVMSSTPKQNPPPPQPSRNENNQQQKYVSTETSPFPSKNENMEPHKAEKVQMTAEAVGSDEAPQQKKLEPTGFTYFDKLNEKDIFLDPLKYF